MVDGIGKNFFSGMLHLHKTKDGANITRQAGTEQAGLISFNKGVDTTKRADLDNISPYASLGVSFSKTPETTEQRIENTALQEFGAFKGNFTLTNVQDANYDLADYRAKLNPAGFAAEYVDPEVVGAHVQDKNSPFAELFA